MSTSGAHKTEKMIEQSDYYDDLATGLTSRELLEKLKNLSLLTAPESEWDFSIANPHFTPIANQLPSTIQHHQTQQKDSVLASTPKNRKA